MDKKKLKHMAPRDKKQLLTGILFIIPAAVMTTVFVVIPAFTVFYVSFTDWNGISPHKNFVGWAN